LADSRPRRRLIDPRVGVVVLAAALGACAVGHADSPPSALESAAGAYLAGQHAVRVDDIRSASRYFDQVLEGDPTNPGLRRRAFLLRLEAGRFDTAGELAPALADEPGEGGSVANLFLAVEAARSGDFTQAAARIDRLGDSRLSRVLGPVLGAWAIFGRGDLEAAEIKLSVLEGDEGFSGLYALHAALLAEAAGETDLAATRYEIALAGPSTPPLRLRLAAAGFEARNGRLEQALRRIGDSEGGVSDPDALRSMLRQLAEAGGPDGPSAARGMAEALFDLASALQRDRGSDSAMVFARLALRLDADFDLAALLVAEILDDRKRWDEALEVYDGIADESPYRLLARLRAASALDHLKRDDEAVRRLETVAGERPDLPDPLVRLGDLHRSRENWSAAIDGYDRAVRRVGMPEPRHWSLFYTRGIALERSKRWAEAEADFLRSLELWPDQPYVLNYLGYSWVDRGENLERAKGMIERAVELRPTDGYIVDSLGWALYRLGDLAGAVFHLERAVELRPTDPTINDHLGDAYWQVGRYTEARFQWRRALTFDPDPELIVDIERKLRDGLARTPPPPAGKDGTADGSSRHPG